MSRLCLLAVLFGFFLKSGVRAQFVSNLKEGALPCTSVPEIAGGNYRFVIIGDLTGGEEPGIFNRAIDRINDLDPDFVISIGDLIDGYTLDTTLINRQWQKFQTSLKKLEAPFFYMAGNHDVANPVLMDVWSEKIGRSYYTFKVGEYLFVVLNTWEPGIYGISKEQTNEIKRAIEKESKETPLFVFTHDPFWLISNQPGVRELNELLGQRNTTFFCGHEHRYLHKIVKGQEHYMLAGIATGGPGMRGPELGEFHNLLFVSVRGDDFKISNMELEGLLSPSVVSNETEKQVDILRDGEWATIQPTVVKNEKASEFTSLLHLKNEGDFPLEINGAFSLEEGFSFSPSEIQLTIPTGQEKQIPIKMVAQKSVEMEQLPIPELTLNGRFLQNDKNLSSPLGLIWTIDYWKTCKVAGENLIFSENQVPAHIDENWDWHGMDDGSFAYRVSNDEKYAYIDIKTSDDSLVNNPDISVIQDKLTLFLSTDTAYSAPDFLQLECWPNDEHTFITASQKPKDITVTSGSEGNSVWASLKLPVKMFEGNCFRLNFSFTDSDDRTNLEPSVLWWKPRWGSGYDYSGSGIFFMNDETEK